MNECKKLIKHCLSVIENFIYRNGIGRRVRVLRDCVSQWKNQSLYFMCKLSSSVVLFIGYSISALLVYDDPKKNKNLFSFSLTTPWREEKEKCLNPHKRFVPLIRAKKKEEKATVKNNGVHLY